MKSLRPIWLAVLVLGTITAATSSANANPYGGYPYGLGFGGEGFLGLGRYHANARVIPYFALYPPVYYSHSVPRPYGYSPFALPPGMHPVEPILEPIVPTAKEIVNPYFKPTEDSTGADQGQKTAKWIINPYVKGRLASKPN